MQIGISEVIINKMKVMVIFLSYISIVNWHE
jgi:hypothetical protein